VTLQIGSTAPLILSLPAFDPIQSVIAVAPDENRSLEIGLGRWDWHWPATQNRGRESEKLLPLVGE